MNVLLCSQGQTSELYKELNFKYSCILSAYENVKSVLCSSLRSCNSTRFPSEGHLAMLLDPSSSTNSRPADPIIPTVVTNSVAPSVVHPLGCSALVGFYSSFYCHAIFLFCYGLLYRKCCSTQMTVSSFIRQSYYREKIMIKQSNNSINLEVKS